MTVDKSENKPVDGQETLETPPTDSGGIDIDSKIESKLTEFEKRINKTLNNVIAKMTKPKPPESSKGDSESDPEVPPESSKNSAEQDTLKALEAKYKRDMEALKKEIEAERNERSKDRKEAFTSRLESQVLKSLASTPDIDDPEGALEVFMLKHNIDSFTPGSNGYIIFKSSEDEDGVTLDDLVKDWMKTKIGKRFIKVTLPNGSGKDTPDNEPVSRTGKPQDLFTKKKAMKEGRVQIKF
jgi:hypothetical protein